MAAYPIFVADVERNWKHRIDPGSMLFYAISFLRTNDTYRQLAQEMRVSIAVISDAIEAASQSEAIFRAFVPQVISRKLTPIPIPAPGVPDPPQVHPIDHIREEFDHHKDMDGAVDCTTVEIEKPRHEPRTYWGTKNHMYGFKLQVVAAPVSGRAMHVFVDAIKTRASCHDKTIFLNSGVFQLVVDVIDGETDEVKERKKQGFDRGYIGVDTKNHYTEAIVMRREPPRGTLSQAARDENDRIEHDRVIVENWNQRFKTWGAMAGRMRVDITQVPGLMRWLRG